MSMGMGKCGCTVMWIVKILLIVGGLNWGLVGLGMLMGAGDSWNVVAMLLGGMPTFEAIVYLLVGVAALVKLFGCRCMKCKTCCSVNEAPVAPAQQ
jgi:uncharacterized membrane protein YuzA (DUF378 family)